MGKLITSNNYLSFRQNQGLAWLLGPKTLGKLITSGNCLSVKQNQGVAWILGPQALKKLTTLNIYLSDKHDLKWSLAPRITYLVLVQQGCKQMSAHEHHLKHFKVHWAYLSFIFNTIVSPSGQWIYKKCIFARPSLMYEPRRLEVYVYKYCELNIFSPLW